MPAPRLPETPLSQFQRARLAAFDTLPEDSIVDDAIAAVILGISVKTLLRQAPVPPRQISERRHGRRVGDLRAKVRGTEAAA